jgi:hypothetical protein
MPSMMLRFGLATPLLSRRALDNHSAPPESVYPGLVSARDNQAKPHTHRVYNIGKTLFDVMDVQVLSRPTGPATEAIAKPAAENAKVRLYRYELAAGESSPQDTHKRPYLMVAATDVNLRITSSAGGSMEHSLKPVFH